MRKMCVIRDAAHKLLSSSAYMHMLEEERREFRIYFLSL